MSRMMTRHAISWEMENNNISLKKLMITNSKTKNINEKNIGKILVWRSFRRHLAHIVPHIKSFYISNRAFVDCERV